MIIKEFTVYLPQDTSVKLSLNGDCGTADMDIERTDEHAPGSVGHVLDVDELRLLAKQFNLVADMIEEENEDD